MMRFIWFLLLFLLFVYSSDKVLCQETGNVLNVSEEFIPSGWMGDGEYEEDHLSLNEAWEEEPFSAPLCIKVSYTPGPKKWAGIYWQNEPDNWGDKKGKNLSREGFKFITFWAKGEKGGEVVEFKAGGINAGKKFKDSFDAKTEPKRVMLSKKWQKFTIDLSGKNLSNVIGGFCWVAAKTSNPEGLTFFLDDIQYRSSDMQGKAGAQTE